VKISKDFGFCAAHRLWGLPDGHKCMRLHGHNYTVRVVLDCPDVDDRGFVLDYGELAPVKYWLDDTWDHRYLNEIPPFDGGLNPTAEHLAAHLGSIVPDLVHLPPTAILEVHVSETPNTWAAWTENGL
jgi:6-pyruvoyltetrahydropterin/6-carboxytetrahydropterin synthase